ncbi:MAG: hypothetical protein ACR2G4_06600 [Pyrinomonadaceae bacterium]
MPRLFVSFLLLLTGVAGFFVSSALLHLGVTKMLVRYPLAILAAYAVFLILLRLWLACQRKTEGGLDWISDLTDNTSNLFDSGGRGETFKFSGSGGDAAGGGAGGSWGESLSSTGLGSNLNVDIDFEEGCFLLILLMIPVLAITGMLLAMFYVIYVAPVFLAEILVDAFLLASLYKRIPGLEPRHWLRSVVRRTLLPVILTTALFIVAGYLMQRAVPEARSIGEFWHDLNSKEGRD